MQEHPQSHCGVQFTPHAQLRSGYKILYLEGEFEAADSESSS